MNKYKYMKINRVLSSVNSVTLDSIRVFAAWCVLLGHCFVTFDMTVLKNENYIFYIQNFAVIIFFSLAGFLMAYSLEKKCDGIQWKNYVIHQGTRIYKVYFPSLLIIFLIDCIHMYLYPANYKYMDALNTKTFFINLFMLQKLNILENNYVFGSARPLWTMAIEWWYYVFFSFFFITFYKKGKKSVLNVVIGSIAVFVFMKFLYSGLAISFILGMIVCIFWKKNTYISSFFWGIVAVIVGVIILTCGVIFKQAYILPIFVLVPILILCLLEWGKNIDSDFRWKRSLRKYAQSTFPLYLLHYPIMELFCSTNLKDEIKFVSIILISNILAGMVSYIFDRNIKIKNV